MLNPCCRCTLLVILYIYVYIYKTRYRGLYFRLQNLYTRIKVLALPKAGKVRSKSWEEGWVLFGLNSD